MGIRMTIASGTLLTALAVAGAAVGHASPNDEQQPAPVNTGGLTAATAPTVTDPSEPMADGVAPPTLHTPAQTGEDPNSHPGAAPATNDDPGAGAAPAPALGGLGGLGSLGSMGSSIGTSMAMMGPMMGMYVPIMGAPMAINAMPGLVDKAVQDGLIPPPVAAGSAEAVDPNLPATLGLVPPADVAAPDADLSTLADAAPASVVEAGSAAAAPALEGGFVPDAGAVADLIGDVGDHVNLGLDTGGIATCGALTVFGWC